jgi:hypothetical protein
MNGKECVKLFYRRESFQQHLRQHHNISDAEKLRDEARSRRIGRNGQIQFWCGFCKVLVPLKFRGLEAWDERFNHIGSHFAQNKKIDEWVPVDSDRPKGETWPESPSMEGKDSGETEGHSPDQPDDNANNRGRRPSPEKAGPQNPGQTPPAVAETIESTTEEPSQYCVSHSTQHGDTICRADVPSAIVAMVHGRPLLIRSALSVPTHSARSAKRGHS